jgi:hypothetical protein
MISSSSFA